jgi:hypothetical protein
MGFILLILGLVYAFKIPGLLRTQPSSFPGADPAVFQTWKSKELGSIYIFLAATWGQTILFFMIGFAIAFTVADPASVGRLIVIVTVIEIGVFLGGLIWSAVLGSQAAKLKKQLVHPVLPPSYYPRQGAVTLKAEASPEENAGQ